MLPTHKDSIAHADDIASLHAWKNFTLRFWEENAPTHNEEQSRQLFHNGFYRSRAALYDLTENDLNAYLSDYQIHRLQSINKTYQTVLSNRVLCNHVMANYFEVEKNYCLITKSGVQWLEPPWWKDETTFPETVQIHSLDPGSYGPYRTVKLSKHSSSLEFQKTFIEQLASEAQETDETLIISAAPTQHRWLTAVSPYGYHLLHVLLVRESNDGLPEIAAASLTIGNSETHASSPAKVEDGALSASITPQTGLITACLTLAQQHKVESCLQHPETGQSLIGEYLPNWEAIKAALLKFFDESSYLHICSLSFVVTETGLSFFGTNTDAMAAHQMHQPLLEHPGIADHVNKVSG